MRVCAECQSIEGKTREMTEAELAELGLEPEDNFEVCAECDTLEDTLRYYNEDSCGDTER